MRILMMILAVAACGTAERAARTSDTADTGAAPSPAAQRPQEVYIDTVEPGNPLGVRGRARTFENTVQVRARDSAGAAITETFTTSVGEVGRHNPYEAQVWLVRNPGPEVTVEAFEYSADDGSVRSLTSRRMALALRSDTITVRFPAADCTTTLPFQRLVPWSADIARLHVEVLLAGPLEAERAGGATAPFPAGSAVKGLALRGGELTVDFNHRLQNVGGSCAALGIRSAVTETLVRLPGVQRVRITAEGSEELALQP